MKARLLKKIINNTGYNVNNNPDYIAVGSPMCHDLISVNKKTLELKYALDTFGEGRKSVEGRGTDGELEFIWDKLQELIDNGQIKDIIQGRDEIENPLPVYAAEDGKIIETFTDSYGWPNTTIDGDIMYNNTWFKTKEEAIAYGIHDTELGVKYAKQRVAELADNLTKAHETLKKEMGYLEHFKSLKAEIKTETKKQIA